MSDPTQANKPDRPALPRDAFRAQRAAADATAPPPVKPVVVTPDYDDRPLAAAPAPPKRDDSSAQSRETSSSARRPKTEHGRNPFDAYGERSSSRPYALRLPDPIDLVLRQMAAEERTHPLRIVDRILYEHLKKAGRLPPTRGA